MGHLESFSSTGELTDGVWVLDIAEEKGLSRHACTCRAPVLFLEHLSDPLWFFLVDSHFQKASNHCADHVSEEPVGGYCIDISLSLAFPCKRSWQRGLFPGSLSYGADGGCYIASHLLQTGKVLGSDEVPCCFVHGFNVQVTALEIPCETGVERAWFSSQEIPVGTADGVKTGMGFRVHPVQPKNLDGFG